jgi:hypothetical protein
MASSARSLFRLVRMILAHDLVISIELLTVKVAFDANRV